MTDIALNHPTIQVRPVTGRIGAEISGVDLSPDLDKASVAAIRQALLRHKVIFFRAQHHLDNAGQEGFAALLGEPVAHPTVPASVGTKYTLDIASTHGGRTNSWHTDVTFVQAYPLASILRAEIIPSAGGDTVWANTAAAYQDLSPELREFVGKLWALHTNDYDYAATRTDISVEHAKQFKAVFASTIYETEHPLVRIHPETGEHVLVLGHFLKKINGLSSVDSASLFNLLQSHVTRPENTVRWRWTPGDVAIWDNRATQHYGVADYGDQLRVLRRVTVAGDVPVSLDGRTSVAKRAPGLPHNQPVEAAA
jgi:taurine dioxygenase